jgi:ArsR family transcriptional regulator
MKAIEQTTNGARAVAILRALANPIRFRIVQELAWRNECIVGDLVDVLPLAQSTVSEHLAVLKQAGVVRGTIDGPNRCYCLDPDAFRFLHTVLAELEPRSCC